MKTIKMSELKPRDVFTHELKIHNREAFLVTEIKESQVLCVSRNDHGTNKKIIKKQKKGNVILLRTLK